MSRYVDRDHSVDISPWGWRVRATQLTIDFLQLLLNDTYLPGTLQKLPSLQEPVFSCC